jgi:hypothetical protein
VRAVKHGAGHGTVRGAGFDPGWLALLAVPLSYACWLVYRALAFGDLVYDIGVVAGMGVPARL